MADIFYPCETAENQIRSLNNPWMFDPSRYAILLTGLPQIKPFTAASTRLLPLPLAYRSLTARLSATTRLAHHSSPLALKPVCPWTSLYPYISSCLVAHHCAYLHTTNGSQYCTYKARHWFTQRRRIGTRMRWRASEVCRGRALREKGCQKTAFAISQVEISTVKNRQSKGRLGMSTHTMKKAEISAYSITWPSLFSLITKIKDKKSKIKTQKSNIKHQKSKIKNQKISTLLPSPFRRQMFPFFLIFFCPDRKTFGLLLQDPRKRCHAM